MPAERDRPKWAVQVIAASERIGLFGAFCDTAVPHLTMAEISVGDAIDDFTDDDVVSLITSLIEPARRPD